MSTTVSERLHSIKEFGPFKRRETVASLSARAITEAATTDEFVSDELIAEIESIDNPLMRLGHIVPLYEQLPDDSSETLDPILDSTSHDTLEWLRELDEKATETHYGVALGIVGVTACIRAWEAHPTDETEQLALSAAAHAGDKDLQATYKRTIDVMKQRNLSYDEALAVVNREILLSGAESHKYEYPWVFEADAPEPEDRQQRRVS